MRGRCAVGVALSVAGILSGSVVAVAPVGAAVYGAPMGPGSRPMETAPQAAPSQASVGAVQGRITSEAGQPVPGAQVMVEGTTLGVISNSDGIFRLEGVPVGAATLSVRMIGYAPQSREVAIAAGETATADFTLQATALTLDDITVDGRAGSAFYLPGALATLFALLGIFFGLEWASARARGDDRPASLTTLVGGVTGGLLAGTAVSAPFLWVAGGNPIALLMRGPLWWLVSATALYAIVRRDARATAGPWSAGGPRRRPGAAGIAGGVTGGLAWFALSAAGIATIEAIGFDPTMELFVFSWSPTTPSSLFRDLASGGAVGYALAVWMAPRRLLRFASRFGDVAIRVGDLEFDIESRAAAPVQPRTREQPASTPDQERPAGPGRIYLSYARQDQALAAAAAAALRSAGFVVVVAYEELVPGRDFQEAVEREIDEADATVALLSAVASESPWVRAETRNAMASGKPVLPVLLEDARIPVELARLHAVDLRGWEGYPSDPRVEELVRAVERLVGRPAGREAPRPTRGGATPGTTTESAPGPTATASDVRIGTIVGRVTDDDGHPVPAAQLTVEGTRIASITGSGGDFRLDDVPAGEQVIRVRAVGLEPHIHVLVVQAGTTSTVTIEVPATSRPTGPQTPPPSESPPTPPGPTGTPATEFIPLPDPPSSTPPPEASPSATAGPFESRRYTVVGRVQGVGFRWWVREQAKELGIGGWVQNVPDGSVLVEAVGTQSELRAFEKRLEQGPQAASVQRLARDRSVPVGEKPSFEIRS